MKLQFVSTEMTVLDAKIQMLQPTMTVFSFDNVGNSGYDITIDCCGQYIV